MVRRDDLLLFVAADSEDQKALARTLPFEQPPSLTTTTQPSFDIWKNSSKILCGNVFDYSFLDKLDTTATIKTKFPSTSVKVFESYKMSL